MEKGYTYEPENIKEFGKDRMRFELGDTLVESGADTSALCDTEIQVMIETYPDNWKRAKLALLESICRRFSYEPDTKTESLSFSFGARANLWREDYETLKAELTRKTICVPKDTKKPPYFYAGMMRNREVGNQ